MSINVTIPADAHPCLYTDPIVKPHNNWFTSTAAQGLSAKQNSSGGKQSEPTTLPPVTHTSQSESVRGELAEVGYEASMGRLLELRREVRELARPQAWCSSCASPGVGVHTPVYKDVLMRLLVALRQSIIIDFDIGICFCFLM